MVGFRLISFGERLFGVYSREINWLRLGFLPAKTFGIGYRWTIEFRMLRADNEKC
jgi:hypothetical protein